MWTKKEARTANIVLAIVGLKDFVSTEVLISTSVLRLNFSAINPAHRIPEPLAAK